jgi:hypothetical protein
VKKFLAELSTDGQGSVFESIAALNKKPPPQSNDTVSGLVAQQRQTPPRFAIQANATKPDTDGSFFIVIQTGANTTSLTIDDEEQGANEQGSYTVHRLARVGQANIIKISAVDRNGNTDTKSISVVRQAVDSRPTFARLTPNKIKPRPARDAVAIIIGIQNYKLIPKAEYANQDAQVFYDYASRALGIQEENIKLLVDDEADVSTALIRACLSLTAGNTPRPIAFRLPALVYRKFQYFRPLAFTQTCRPLVSSSV